MTHQLELVPPIGPRCSSFQHDREQRAQNFPRPGATMHATSEHLSPSQSILASSWIQAQGLKSQTGMGNFSPNVCSQLLGHIGTLPEVNFPYPSRPFSTSPFSQSSTGSDASPISLSALAQPFQPASVTTPNHASHAGSSSNMSTPELEPTAIPEVPVRMFDSYADMVRANNIWKAQDNERRAWYQEQDNIAAYGQEAWKIGKLMARENAHHNGFSGDTFHRPCGKYSRENFFPQEKCVVCMGHKPEVGYMPCRHLAACIACQRQLAANGGASTCPLCRRDVVDYEYMPESPAHDSLS